MAKKPWWGMGCIAAGFVVVDLASLWFKRSISWRGGPPITRAAMPSVSSQRRCAGASSFPCLLGSATLQSAQYSPEIRAAPGWAATWHWVAASVFRRTDGGPPPPPLDPASQGLREVRAFLGHVRTAAAVAEKHARHPGVLHALNHLDRVCALSRDMAQHRKARRLEALALAVSGDVNPDAALERLEALRWLDRVTYHVWRSVRHPSAPGGEPAAGRAPPLRRSSGNIRGDGRVQHGATTPKPAPPRD